MGNVGQYVLDELKRQDVLAVPTKEMRFNDGACHVALKASGKILMNESRVMSLVWKTIIGRQGRKIGVIADMFVSAKDKRAATRRTVKATVNRQMLTKLYYWWQKVRSSFWFTPSLIVVLSVAFAVAMIEADSAGSNQWLTRWPRVFGAGAKGARGMMSTIAGSMITVVGVTFSMILVVLSLASSQYTSRILRNFMRSRITQVVLGIFAGIFTYCLIVLRTIRGAEEGAFVPNLAVFFGFVLALGGVGALMFLHSSHRFRLWNCRGTQ